MISNFYSWFSRMYGQNLHDYLRGCDYEGTVNNAMNLYPRIFLTVLVVTLLIAVFFYFFNKSNKFNTWKSWLVMLCTGAAFAWIFGFAFTYNRYDEIPDCFKYSPPFQENGFVETENCEQSFDEYGDSDEMTENEDEEFEQSSEEYSRGGQLVGVPGTECLFSSHFSQFGFANAIVSVILFVFFSLIFNWFSINCNNCPFNFKKK